MLDSQEFFQDEFQLETLFLAKVYYINKRAWFSALIVYYFLQMIAFTDGTWQIVIICKK